MFVGYFVYAICLPVLLWKQVMPAVVNVMKEEASLVTLVKPQFEARRSQARNLIIIQPLGSPSCSTKFLLG